MKQPKYYHEKYWVKVTQYEMKELSRSVNAWTDDLIYNFENFLNSKLHHQLYMNLVTLQNLSDMLKFKQKQHRQSYAIQLHANQAFTLMHLLIGDTGDSLVHVLHQLDHQYKNRIKPEQIKTRKSEPLKQRNPVKVPDKIIRGKTQKIASLMERFKPKKAEYKNIYQLSREDLKKNPPTGGRQLGE